MSKYAISQLTTTMLCLLASTITGQSAWGQSNSQPTRFVISPMIEAFGYCESGVNEKNTGNAVKACVKKGHYGIPELQAALDKLEPGGAKGQVQVGYTLGINLLTMEQDGAQALLERFTRAVHDIRRPLVIYLFANHFASSTLQRPLTGKALARFPNQAVPKEKYFGGGLSALTLNMSPEIQLNRLRFNALAKVAKWYISLPAESKDRIIGFTLAGELHHFFDDFSTGLGRYENIRVTDYSLQTTAEFSSWLRNRYKTINHLNNETGGKYRQFKEIIPPSKNVKLQKSFRIHEHFDSFSHGIMPIDGWLENLPNGHSINVYLDGKLAGSAEYGLNRQDVYEALASTPSAQVGFRYLLDFSKLQPGPHVLHLTVDGPKGYLLAKRTFVVLGKAEGPAASSAAIPTLAAAPKEARFYLDRPADGQVVLYNPLARDWYAFRSHQVTAAYEAWFDRSVALGLPANKLYSHQIAAATVGGWNPVLLASDESIQGKRRYQKGINLYGGSASMELLRRHYLSKDEPFAVPEFHSQAWKDLGAPTRMLKTLRNGGAAFVTPYFLSVEHPKFRDASNAHNKFRLALDNPDYGSDQLYRAIGDMAKE